MAKVSEGVREVVKIRIFLSNGILWLLPGQATANLLVSHCVLFIGRRQVKAGLQNCWFGQLSEKDCNQTFADSLSDNAFYLKKLYNFIVALPHVLILP